MGIKIRVGGVPEHFNLPWHLAIEHGHFRKKGMDMEWKTFHGGTGEMCKALRENKVDVCVILTEGIIADIVKGNPSKIIGNYINTPLIWGIHTGVQNEIEQYEEIFTKTYAISRYGSGSHLMAVVDAHSKGYKLMKEQFNVIGNIDRAIDSLTKFESDVFYWEKFMTKPYVDDGKLKRVGEYLTPWPSFVIAARNDFIASHSNELADMLTILRFNCDQFMRSTDAIDMVSRKYNLQIEDVEQWFHLTEWSTDNTISAKMIENVLFALKNAGIIKQEELRAEFIQN